MRQPRIISEVAAILRARRRREKRAYGSGPAEQVKPVLRKAYGKGTGAKEMVRR